MISRKWYFLPIFLLIIGQVAMAFTIYRGLVKQFSSLTKLGIPSQQIIKLQKGDYFLYFEFWNSSADDLNKIKNLDEVVTVKITNLKTSSELELFKSNHVNGYGYGNCAGIHVWDFEISETGEYSISTRYANIQNAKPFRVALEQNTFAPLTLAIKSMILGLGSLVGAVAIFIVIYIRRKKILRDPGLVTVG